MQAQNKVSQKQTLERKKNRSTTNVKNKHIYVYKI